MGDLLHSPALIPAGATGILAVVVMLILRGLLLPKGTVTQIIQVKDERLADAIARGDEYKKAAETYRDALQTRDLQLSELLEYARTANQLLNALREVIK